MLWVAGVLAILAGMPQLGFAIFVVSGFVICYRDALP
jgi:hypothetical protein